MSSNVCDICERSFSRKSNLVRHITNRETSCHPVTHHCSKCNKGFSSYQSLWEHRNRCEDRKHDASITQIYEGEGGNSTPSISLGTLDGYLNEASNHSSSMNVVPYMNLSKSDDTVETPAKRVKIGTPMAPRKEHDRYSRVNRIIANCSLPHSDVKDDDADEYDDELDKLLNQLVVLSDLVDDGYITFRDAIIGTLDALEQMDGLKGAQYQSLATAINKYL